MTTITTLFQNIIDKLNNYTILHTSKILIYLASTAIGLVYRTYSRSYNHDIVSIKKHLKSRKSADDLIVSEDGENCNVLLTGQVDTSSDSVIQKINYNNRKYFWLHGRYNKFDNQQVNDLLKANLIFLMFDLASGTGVDVIRTLAFAHLALQPADYYNSNQVSVYGTTKGKFLYPKYLVKGSINNLVDLLESKRDKLSFYANIYTLFGVFGLFKEYAFKYTSNSEKLNCRSQADKLEEGYKCLKCKERKSNVISLSCSHFVLCYDCFIQNNRKCFLCDVRDYNYNVLLYKSNQ